jgi:two-component system response regulator FixJ
MFCIHLKEEPPSVYVVDDDPILYESLRRDYASARWFSHAASFLEWLDSADVERVNEGIAVVVEARLGDADGLDLIDRLREGGCRLPVLVVCRNADVPTAVRAMQHGAVDFLARPLPPGLLASSLRLLSRSR